MTAPDPGLTDLIAAHLMELDFFRVDCVCGESFGSESQWYAHFGAAVEQHTNRRIAELESERDALYNIIHRLSLAIEGASERRAALEGEQQ